MRGLILGLTLASAAFAAPCAVQAADLSVATNRTPATAKERREARRRKREERRDDRNDALEDRRPDIEDFQIEPLRKGFYIGGGLYGGVSLYSRGFVPSIGHRFDIGGGLSDRWTLGVSGGISGHQGMRKGVAGIADLVVSFYPLYGLYVRAGLGVSSHAPVRSRRRRPGAGGIAGFGWEFRPLEHLAVAVGADYEGRLRPDGFYVQGVMFNVSLRTYLNFKR